MAEPDLSPLLVQETRALRPLGSLKSILYSLGKVGFFSFFLEKFPSGPEPPWKSAVRNVAL